MAFDDFNDIDHDTDAGNIQDRYASLERYASDLENRLSKAEGELAEIKGSRAYALSLVLSRFVNRVIRPFFNYSRFVFVKKILRKMRPARQAGLEQVADEVRIKNRVSIIIPVYNNAQYLRKCLDSAIGQRQADVEVIAINDCSTDPQVNAILADYIGKPGVQILNNSLNSGISKTMNHGIVKATGEWLAFLDCDDWLEPDAVSRLMHVLQANPGSLYGYTDRMNEHADGSSVLESFKSRPRINYLDELIIGMYTSHLKIIHHRVFLKTGLHESRFDGTQDYDIALKTAFHFGDDAFAYLAEPVYHHRIHGGQVSSERMAAVQRKVEKTRVEARLRKSIRAGDFSKKVSCIILSFEKREMTRQCVKAIAKNLKIGYEVILFDNGSSRETVEFLKKEIEPLEHVKAIYSETNLGAPLGRQTAVRHASGDYLLFLDNDVIISEGCIEELLVKAESEPDIGAVCCKIVLPDGTVQMNGGRYYIDNGFIAFTMIDSQKREGDLETADWHACQWVPAGATLMKRELTDQLDFHGGYINSYEDNDVSLQIGRLKYAMRNCPSARVRHHHVMYAEEKAESGYMKARYDNRNFVKSLLNFYVRNQLIIKDRYALALMNLAGKSDQDIKMAVELEVQKLDRDPS